MNLTLVYNKNNLLSCRMLFVCQLPECQRLTGSNSTGIALSGSEYTEFLNTKDEAELLRFKRSSQNINLFYSCIILRPQVEQLYTNV